MVHFASEREICFEAANLFGNIIKFARSKLKKSAVFFKVLNLLPMGNLKDLSMGKCEVVLACVSFYFKYQAMVSI